MQEASLGDPSIVRTLRVLRVSEFTYYYIKEPASGLFISAVSLTLQKDVFAYKAVHLAYHARRYAMRCFTRPCLLS